MNLGTNSYRVTANTSFAMEYRKAIRTLHFFNIIFSLVDNLL